MKKFKMYNEWRGVEVYGNSLADAIMRRKRFQRPDIVKGCKEGIVTRTDGEWVEVAKVIGTENTDNSNRGGERYERVVCELVNGDIVGFDVKDLNIEIK